jgi:hypothetical protein
MRPGLGQSHRSGRRTRIAVTELPEHIVYRYPEPALARTIPSRHDLQHAAHEHRLSPTWKGRARTTHPPPFVDRQQLAWATSVTSEQFTSHRPGRIPAVGDGSPARPASTTADSRAVFSGRQRHGPRSTASATFVANKYGDGPFSCPGSDTVLSAGLAADGSGAATVTANHGKWLHSARASTIDHSSAKRSTPWTAAKGRVPERRAARSYSQCVLQVLARTPAYNLTEAGQTSCRPTPGPSTSRTRRLPHTTIQRLLRWNGQGQRSR